MGQEVNAIIDQFPAYRVSTEEGLLLLGITAGGLILGLAMVWTLLKLRSGMQRRAEKRVAAVVVSTTDPVSTPENRPTKPPVAIQTAPNPRKPPFGRLKALMSPKAAAASKTAVQEPPRSRPGAART